MQYNLISRTNEHTVLELSLAYRSDAVESMKTKLILWVCIRTTIAQEVRLIYYTYLNVYQSH